MFLSTLLIETGTNPDRPRPGRMWLRNMYRVHQRLCMAFPSAQRKCEDKQFLQPYRPEDFPEDRHRADESPAPAKEVRLHVHARRDEHSGFLFRVDPLAGGNCVIVVLSAFLPDWEYAFCNARHFLAAPPQIRPFSPQIAAGQQWRFRTVCNAVFRARETSKHAGGEAIHAKWVRKRIGVPGDEKSLRNWIDRRAEAAGFTICSLDLAQPGYAYINKSKDGSGQRLRSVRYEGVLEVTDAEAFRKTLACGIGPAKAFGFGLLSVAPV